MNSLLIYSSTDGQTKKICDEIRNNSIHKKTYKLVSINEAADLNLNDFDQIILGASIRYGRHDPKIYKFIKSNKDTLKGKKNAFFSVNVVARKPEKSTPETNPYIRKFIKKSEWLPMKLGVFAGKVDYPNLNFINRNIIKFIMFITNGPTDTKKVFEFTNWQQVKKFTKEFDDMQL